MAYVRTKTINGVTYDYLVKSVRDGKKARQVFVRYIGKHPPGAGQGSSGGAASRRVSSSPGGFQALCGADARTRCVALFYDLGCQRVVFSLRSNRRHSAVYTLHYPETGEIEISKVRLHREASMQAICHEVDHVLDTVLQKQNPSSGTLWHYMQGGPGVFMGDLHYYFTDGDLRQGLAEGIDTRDCPVYLLTGEYDTSATPAMTQEVADRIGATSFQVMNGMGHFPMSENPETFRDYLLPVLEMIRAQDN